MPATLAKSDILPSLPGGLVFPSDVIKQIKSKHIKNPNMRNTLNDVWIVTHYWNPIIMGITLVFNNNGLDDFQIIPLSKN